MLKFLQELLAKRQKEVKALQSRSDASESLEEVKALAEEIKAKGQEIVDLTNQIAEIEANKESDNGGEGIGGAGEGNDPARGLNPLATYRMNGGQPERRVVSPSDTIEYRTAFMNYACRNVQIPSELRASATTNTTDASAVIPTTIMNEIVKELKLRGNIWNKVRRLNIAGGVEVPILSLKPQAKWIAESTTKIESQKLQANASVSFKYYGLEVKLSQTLLANVVTLEIFQEQFVELAVEAIIEAVEIGVFNGTGTGQMLGILKDTRVPATNKIEMTDAEFGDWKAWKKKVFGAIKPAYGTGEFYMAKATFDGEIDGMVDANKQPIARVNYGLANEPEYRFGGKVVEVVEADVIKDFSTAVAGDVVAVFVNLKDYAINSNLEMKMDKWEDKDTHEIKNNCLMILDGKLIDPNGVILVTKKGTA